MLEYNISPITLECLRRSNASVEAQQTVASYYEARDRKAQTLVICCGDARHMLPDNCPYLRSLAAGAPLQGFAGILNNGVRNAAVLGHFDGDLTDKELKNEAFSCAARHAKAQQLKAHRFVSGSSTFFENNVAYPNLLLQTLNASSRASSLTTKSIMAAVQNHLNGDLIPLAVLKDREIIQQRPILDGLIDGTVNFSGQYHDFVEEVGIPDKDIPDEFMPFVLDTRTYAEKMRQEYSNLTQRLKVHNPRMMVVSSNLKNPSTWLPMLREPGFSTLMNLPRVPSIKGTEYTAAEYEVLGDQLSLLTHEANNNAGIEGAPYSATMSLLVVRGDMGLSVETMDHLLQKSPDLAVWNSRTDTSVFLAEIKQGRFRFSDYYQQER